MSCWYFSREPQSRSSRSVVGERVVAGRHQPALAEGAEVLGRIEAEAAERAERARLRAAVARAVRLCGVLDHGEAVPGGDRADRIHVRHLAVEVDRASPRASAA